MAAITRKQIISDQALKAPLELAENFAVTNTEVKTLLDSLSKLATAGKKVDANLDLAKSTKEVAKETESLTLAQTELEKIDKRITTAQTRQNAEYVQKEKQLKGIRAESKRLINEENRLLGTEEKLIKTNKELLTERRALNKETEEGAARAEDINKQLNENNEALKGSGSELEKNRLQVGGYREALEGLGVNIDGVTDKAGGIGTFFKLFTGGIGSATKASLAFIATPIGAILAAIVGAIALLTLAISNNQGAADDFNKIWGGITSVLDEVFSRVVRLATAFTQFVQGNFAEAAQTASMAFNNLSESLLDAFNNGQLLVQMQIDLEEATISATTATAKLEGEIELLNITIGNGTKSIIEREAAAVSARQKESELAQINLDLAQKELDIINLQTAILIKNGQDKRADLQLQADALAKVIEVSNAALAIEATNQLEIDQLRQDRVERDLDILIDGFDNVKTINERIINDDKRTIRNRREGLDELVQLGSDSFNAQIANLRKFTSVSFDENELLMEQDAVALSEKLRNSGLSDILEGRLLEAIRDRRTALADIAELEESLQQASIDRLQSIADNEKNITDERISALLEIGDLRLSILDDQLEKGIVNEQEFSDKVLQIQEDLANNIAELQLQRFDEDFTDQQLDADTERINKLIELNEGFRSGEIDSVEEFERRKLEIEQQGARASLEAQLDFLEERKGLLENAGVDTSAIDKGIAEVRLELSKTNNDKILDNESKLQDALNDLKNAAVESTLSIIDSFNEAEDEKRAERLEVLEEQEATALEAAGNNEAKKQEIQVAFAAKRKSIEDEQAKANRRRAIFEKTLAVTDIAINTAIAISKAVAAFPVTGGLPFSAIVAAIGAVQIAAVLAKPIPAFMTGTDSAPSGLKMINEEAGGEAWVTPSGELRYAGDTGAMIVGNDVIPTGSQIFTSAETAKMMSNPIEFGSVSSGVGYSPSVRSSESSALSSGIKSLIRQGEETNRTIRNKKEYHLNISKHSTDKLTKSGENWLRLLNSEYN